MVRLLSIVLAIGVAIPACSGVVLADSTAADASKACKIAVRNDKQLTELKNRTVCYQAAVQGDHYARKMLHRSAFFAVEALRLYLDAAIPGATPSLESNPHHTKRLQRQQAAFWRETKDADSDLLFLQESAGLPYRIAKDTQKGKIAEIIVHFQKGLNTNIESTSGGGPLAGRYLLSMPAGTWLIDDFEPVRMELEITQIGLWLGDYVNYARSAYGNDIDLGFIALANEAGLSHFWLTGESGQDAAFLSRNQGKGWGGEPPLITSLSADSDSGVFINIGFQKKESDEPNAPSTTDPLERAQYKVVKRDGQWYIASFKKIDATQTVLGEASDDEQWVFENAASVTEYLSQSQTLSKNLKICKPSEFHYSVPTTPPKQLRFIIQGSEASLCRFKVMVVGAIGVLCKAPTEVVEAQLAMEQHWVEQLQLHRDGPFPLRLTADENLVDNLGNAMAKFCEMTVDEATPVDMEKFIDDSFAYLANLQSCSPSTYSYAHPMVPGFIGNNVIKGYRDGNCLIEMHMPNDVVMKCKASSRTVELMQYQTRVMLKELQDTGQYSFSVEINIGTGSTSELSKLMGEECHW